ncbi:MAG: NBR1-Ig-like domain-containing protein [Anaerolineaceae bacterium]|nr:NBR1-Ig-like domain-containing protein [Anaerolineaceae bacterium]
MFFYSHMMKKLLSIFSLLLVTGLAACTYPSINLAVTPNATLIYQAIDSKMTQSAAQGTTLPPISTVIGINKTSLPPLKPTISPQAVETLPADNNCDRAAAGVPIDVTIQDNTLMTAGELFTKTWRLVNIGTCPWTQNYALIWFSGENMGTSPGVYLNQSVATGQSVDIPVDMVAPNRPGIYQSNWKLRNGNGKLFGIGPNADSPVWVRIIVIETDTETPAPQPTPSLTPEIYASGIIKLTPGYSLDLDSGGKNRGLKDDLSLSSPLGKGLQLAPINGATLAVFGGELPSEAECQSLSLSSDSLPMQGFDPGIYLCYRTNEGLPGYIHLADINLPARIITLDFATWAIP